MRQYELTYLISDNVPEADLNKVTGKVGGYVTSLDGKILKEEIWGRRKLVYPIKKQGFATYVTLNISLPAEKANEFERNLFISSKIIRHLMIVQDYGSEELTLSAEDVAETEEITKVIGGEKSFEAVVGETEESKDLMSVRGEEAAPETDNEQNKPLKEEKIEEKIEEKEEKAEAEEEKAKETEEEKTKEKKSASEIEGESDSTESDKSAVKEKVKSEKKPASKTAPTTSPKASVGVPTESVGKKKVEDEADRLSKLDKELDDILGDDL